LFAPKENTAAPFNAMMAAGLPVRKFAMSPIALLAPLTCTAKLLFKSTIE
jgi:hypothetical protein